MVALSNTEENSAKVKALKKIENTVGKIFWSGNIVLDCLDKCLTGINLNSLNSGWYNPTAVKINGLSGYYMINQDGSLFFEARIIKQDEKKYLIEYITSEGLNVFEELYRQYIEQC